MQPGADPGAEQSRPAHVMTIPLNVPGVTAGDQAAWEAGAAAVLRKARRISDTDADSIAWAKLTKKTVEGLAVTPIGVADDTPVPPARRARRPETQWDIRIPVIDTDPQRAAEAILADLDGGASSVHLTVGGKGTAIADVTAVLDGVLLDLAPVVVEAADGTEDLLAATALAETIRAKGVTPAAGTSLGADPISHMWRAGSDLTGATENLAAIVALARELGIGAIVVDSTIAHDTGAGDSQELAYAIAVGTTYLRLLADIGIEPAQAARLISFRMATTAEQFPTIAKLRAARQLWARVLELCGVTEIPMVLHGASSRPMMTRYDPWVNMLRGTVAAFAAGVGGADAVSVLPFDASAGVPDAFGRRIARNVSHLLIGESHVAAVDDPAGGASAVEQLTSTIAEAAWAEFGRIEQAGGLIAALTDGSYAQRVAVTVAERTKRIAKRSQAITGVSEFPNLGESLPQRPGEPIVDVPSWAAPWEQLRDHAPAAPVFLATMGPVAAHTGRATFMTNLFAAGGISIVDAGATTDADDLTSHYDPAVTPVVCLAGADTSYAEWGIAAAQALREKGAKTVLLAGKPSPEIAEHIDHSVALGADIIAFLNKVRTLLTENGAGK